MIGMTGMMDMNNMIDMIGMTSTAGRTGMTGMKDVFMAWPTDHGRNEFNFQMSPHFWAAAPMGSMTYIFTQSHL